MGVLIKKEGVANLEKNDTKSKNNMYHRLAPSQQSAPLFLKSLLIAKARALLETVENDQIELLGHQCHLPDKFKP